MPCLHFSPLSRSSLFHLFTLRQPFAVEGPADLLKQLGFPPISLVQAEQPHGGNVAAVDASHTHRIIPGVDALTTDVCGLNLVVRVADCGPVYLHDPIQNAIGLVHSGKKGTAAEILPATIRHMQQEYGTRPEDLIVVLGPCIRPPHYDIDFAAVIATQARSCGVKNYHDCGLNTGADLSRFYSYRVEKGQTGRHYAILGLAPGQKAMTSI